MRGNNLVLAVTRVIQNFPRRMFMPYFSLYVLALGGSTTDIGLIRAVGSFAVLIILPIAGYLTDLKGRVKMIPLGGYAWASTFLLIALAGGWPTIAMAIFLQGLFSFHFPALGAIQADSLPPEQRGIGIATGMAITGAVGIVSPYIGGYIVTKLGVVMGTRYLLVATIVGFTVSATLRLKYLKETLTGPKSSISLMNIPLVVKESYQSLVGVLRWMPRNLMGLVFISILNRSFNVIVGSFWIVYAIEVIELTVIEWGVIGLVVGVIRVALAIPAGLLIDRVGKRKIIITSLALTILPTFFFIYSKTFVETLVIALIISTANAFMAPAGQALLADMVPRKQRGSVMATLGRGMLSVSGPGAGGGQLVQPNIGVIPSIPVIAASVIGGYLYSINPTYPWFLTTAALLICLILSIFLVRDPKEMEI